LRSLLLILEYDGTDFAGFQVQPSRRTVQGELEAALARVTGEQIRINGAGRTDAGVHATGQVASLTTASRLDVEVLSRALNACLPGDLVVRLAREVPEGFHARYSARSRVYRYLVWNGRAPTPLGRRYSHHWPRPLDLGPVEVAAESLIGTHDFASFAGAADPSRTGTGTTVREVMWLRCRRQGNLVEFGVEANAFLPKMVRNLVGTLLLVGSGKLRVEQVSEILGARNRAMAGPTAPPEGLCLVLVRYPSAALGALGAEAIAGGDFGEPLGQVSLAVLSRRDESQWRQDETPDDARSES
jgi:tRNA pseudouridine38-40 synthase